MTHSHADAGSDLCAALVESYAVNERMNQIVLENLDPAAWRAKLPGSKGRTIAAIVAHVHNIRRKWLRLSAPHLKLPAPLDRASCTQKQARAALAESAARCSEMLSDALCKPRSRVKTFRRDGWARPWPAGAAMVAFMLSHDAHHRGQVCMLAHQLGFPLPMKAASGNLGLGKAMEGVRIHASAIRIGHGLPDDFNSFWLDDSRYIGKPATQRAQMESHAKKTKTKIHTLCRRRKACTRPGIFTAIIIGGRSNLSYNQVTRLLRDRITSTQWHPRRTL